MSTKKSLFSKGAAVLFSLIILAGGAAKLYRGMNDLGGSKGVPKVRELLNQSDAAIAQATRGTDEVMPVFDELLEDFDKLGHAAFRIEKRESSTKVMEQLVTSSKHYRTGYQSLTEAIQYESDKNIVAFLTPLSLSYELLAKVSEKNVEIIATALDESLTDTNDIVQKILAIAKSRDAYQKEADEAIAKATELSKRS